MDEQKRLEVLHVLRNPYGYSTEAVRLARLDAADIIESQQAEIAALKAVKWQRRRGDERRIR